MSNDKLREDFENWVKSSAWCKFSGFSLDTDEGIYVDADTEAMWQAVSGVAAITQQPESDKQKCPECNGMKWVDDAEPGDISCNTWKCKACAGRGFLPQPTPQLPEGLRRYDVSSDAFNSEMEENETGAWVRFSDVLSGACSIVEKREWIQGAPVYEGEGGILHIPLRGCPNYLAVGFVTEDGGLEDQRGDPIGYEAEAVEKWIKFPDIPLAGKPRPAPPVSGGE